MFECSIKHYFVVVFFLGKLYLHTVFVNGRLALEFIVKF